jgi:transcriptional regulator with XRE-family HTH domain
VIPINLIKKLRVNKELTQLELAEACGVTQGTVAQWEKGICFPKSGKIPALCRVLECDCDELLKMAEERQKVGA